MMDISTLKLEHIELFANVNTAAVHIFGVSPIQASQRKQRKIRKWVNATYIDSGDLPQELFSFVDNSKSDLEVMQFLSACSDFTDKQETLKMQAFKNVTSDFPEEVKQAFIHLYAEIEYCYNVETQENKIIIPLEDCHAFKRKLILYSPKENPLRKFDLLYFGDMQILKEANGYQLNCASENFDEEEPVSLSFFFDRADTETEIYRADRREFDDNPWDSLAFLAMDILDKNRLGAKYCNEKEIALLPLLKELRTLLHWMPEFDEETPNFEILKQYIKKHNLSHLIPLLDKFAKKKPASSFITGCLSNALNDAACENLWRELYELIADTQKEYADKILSYDQKKLQKIRLEIEECFQDLGYGGKYPTFSKKGKLKGIRLEESYNQSYFVVGDKNGRYIVQCRELLFSDMLHIQFICGTAFPKIGETITDIYSCCFNKKGRRIFKKLFWDAAEMDTLAQFVTIATKRAECTKLSKLETELLGNVAIPWQYYLTIFIFMGGLFAILFTVAMFLFFCLLTAILDGVGAMLEMISDIPWWLLFAMSFVGFGGAMTIVDVKAKTK